MSIPLDRLYNHLDGLCNHDVIIYRFFPHGSKKLEDLDLLTNYSWFDKMTKPTVICHDQEPLNFDLYSQQDFNKIIDQYLYPDAMNKEAKQMHIRGIFKTLLNVYDKAIIVHSEKNSKELQRYEQTGLIGVYWWAHAAIARDWFRYAEHDVVLQHDKKNVQHDFLVYNRAWSGTREYRLKFSELLVEHQLVGNCNVKFSPIDGVHYTQHKFNNSTFAINRQDIEQHIPINESVPSASADYNAHDYQRSSIEVVLETLFDDSRQHLTEKALRPIACGIPFILVSTPGCLEYLRSYGFETFSEYIDESYDSVLDPIQRLHAVIKEMKRISQLGTTEKMSLMHNLNAIAKRNQAKFFSNSWSQSIWAEFLTNLNKGLETMNTVKKASHWKNVNQKSTGQALGLKHADSEEDSARLLNLINAIL